MKGQQRIPCRKFLDLEEKKKGGSMRQKGVKGSVDLNPTDG